MTDEGALPRSADTSETAIELARRGGFGLATDRTIDDVIAGSARSMLEVMSSDPMKAPQMLALLASSQVALHRVEVSSAPDELWPAGSTAEVLIDDVRSDVELVDSVDYERELAWLASHEHSFESRPEDIVLCHGDFQPANLAVDTSEDDGDDAGDLAVVAVVGWHSALVGDRHHDVAITRGLFWVAPFLAPGRKERMALKVVRDFLANAYRDKYAGEVELDETQLLVFEALGALVGSVRIAAFHATTARGEQPPGRLTDPALMPVELIEALRERFWDVAAQLDGDGKRRKRRR